MSGLSNQQTAASQLGAGAALSDLRFPGWEGASAGSYPHSRETQRTPGCVRSPDILVHALPRRRNTLVHDIQLTGNQVLVIRRHAKATRQAHTQVSPLKIKQNDQNPTPWTRDHPALSKRNHKNHGTLPFTIVVCPGLISRLSSNRYWLNPQ
ncbi:hypothetical protein B0T17DRAFT_511624 [Bombardia bombarda]|uniref:Uncharacterized protein n=1 Tax=Bombardia bombarda TaxID=252184 RepID=A0AA39WD05_9PEZI|nr:hypothetical protein B0T17DRAFT_511624 [Bombardia bombarda]